MLNAEPGIKKPEARQAWAQLAPKPAGFLRAQIGQTRLNYAKVSLNMRLNLKIPKPDGLEVKVRKPRALNF